jgi:hypothetical protein
MTEAPPGSARVSSEGSWAAGNPFVGNAGPPFDPQEATQPEQATPLHVLDVIWSPERLKTLVRAQGLITHDLIGVGREDWLWRDSELQAIAEPLANAFNKIPVVRAAAAVSDELTAGAVLGEYCARSIRERHQVLRARKAQQRPAPPVPVTGVDADGHRFDQLQPDQWQVPE